MALTAAGLLGDLGTYLNLGAKLDSTRGTLVLDLALQRAQAIVDPVPDPARPLILDVAARGYVNPEGTVQESVGGIGRTYSSQGVYLTRRERADLRRLRGGAGGAFTVNPIAPVT